MGGEKEEEEGVGLVREWVWCGLDLVRMCRAGNKAVVSSVPFSIPSVLRSASALVGATLCLLVQIGLSRDSERTDAGRVSHGSVVQVVLDSLELETLWLKE